MTTDLPPGLQKHGRNYRCRVYVNGRRQWKNLGPDLPDAIDQFDEIRNLNPNNLASAIKRYLREVLPHKARSTQLQQERQAERLSRVFGAMHPSEIRQAHAVKYIDMRGNVAGNREIALLRHILTKCVHWDLLPANPLMRMQYRHPERGRDRDVDSLELKYVMKRAGQRERLVMWLVYLTGLRRQDVLNLNDFHMKKDGIHTREGKTGKAIRIGWTPSLVKAVKKAQKAAKGTRLFDISSSGFDTAWQRLRRKLRAEGYELFQLKDLRAAHAGEIDDKGGDATRQLGHSSRSVTSKHYLRRGRRVTPIR